MGDEKLAKRIDWDKDKREVFEYAVGKTGLEMINEKTGLPNPLSIEPGKRIWSVKKAIELLISLSHKFTEAQRANLFDYLQNWSKEDKDRFKEEGRYQIAAKPERDQFLAIKEYLRTKEIFRSWFTDGEHVDPYDFISWAMEHETIDVPEVMAEWKQKQDALAAGAKIETRGRPKERLPDAACKIIAVLLGKAGYELDDCHTKGKLKAEINKIGYTCDEKTIGGYLQQVQEFLNKEKSE